MATLTARPMAAQRASAPAPRAIPALRARPCRPLGLRVLASASNINPVPSDPTPTPPGTPSLPTPPIFLRTAGTGGTGGLGGAGLGGGGSGTGRPIGTGGPGGLPTPPPINWRNVLIAALAVAIAVPLWQYLNRRYIFKPEPEHTLAKAEDKAAEIKSKTHTGPGGILGAVKHSETGRAVQHKAEDVKDSADVGLHSASSKAERTGSHIKKDLKHGVENAKEKAEDVAAAADTKGHEAKVKGGRTLQRVGEKIEDTAYAAEVTASRAGKGVLEGIKSAATTVGRKLHVVADATEKGTKKAVNKAERGPHTPATSESERRAVYYTVGGVALGASVLAALYYWDKKGGDLSGKMRRITDRTKDAADQAVAKAKGALARTQEPAGPTAPKGTTGTVY